MSLDLLLRYLIISIAMQVACAWIQTFQSPWPLADAFELAENAEEQLFQSLGVSFRSLIFCRVFHAVPRAFNVLYASACVSLNGLFKLLVRLNGRTLLVSKSFSILMV